MGKAFVAGLTAQGHSLAGKTVFIAGAGGTGYSIPKESFLNLGVQNPQRFPSIGIQASDGRTIGSNPELQAILPAVFIRG